MGREVYCLGSRNMEFGLEFRRFWLAGWRLSCSRQYWRSRIHI